MRNNLEEFIEINPQIMLGKPVIKGTRITVELILEKLIAGETFNHILEAHPRLKYEHILAALQYALKAIKNEDIYISVAA
jgi:uncharacterized protein (DUF433 family)